MTNKSISQLTAGGAVSSTDLFPDVQTVGVGPVRVTAAQIGNYVLSGSGLTGVLPVSRGGTGLTSLTAGRIPYGDGTNAFGNSANLFWDAANNQLDLGAGTVSFPSLSTVSDNNTGIYFPAADTIGFVEGGVESMRIDASGNLLVGQSTSRGTRATFYGVNGAAGSDNGVVDINTTNALGANLGGSVSFGGVSNSGGAITRYAMVAGRKENATSDSFTGYLQFATTGSDGITGERMRLDAYGNLGLGVTPSAWNSDTRAIQFREGYGAVTGNNGDGSINITTNAFRNSAGSWIYNNSYFASRYQQINSQHQWFTAASGTAGNAISFTQAMTLDASGNLGIGTSSPGTIRLKIETNTSGYALQTAGTVNDYYGMSIYNTNSGSSARSFLQFGNNTSQFQAFISLNSSANSDFGGANALNIVQGGAAPLAFATSNTERMRIDSSGNLLVGTTTTRTNTKLVVNGGSYAEPAITSGGVQISSRFGPFNDNNANSSTGDGIINTSGCVLINSAAGVTSIPVFANGGGGVGWRWTYLDPDAGTWAYSPASDTVITFTQAGTGGNSYTVTFSYGNGAVTVQRTAGSLEYSFMIQKFSLQ